jgi:TonB family protein
MTSAAPTLVADAALRLPTPLARPGERARHVAAALIALTLELGVIALVVIERPPPQTPQAIEIPVEIVPEPSPTPTPTSTPPPPVQNQEYEKPATDAPRAGKSDHDDETVAEKEKPAAAPPPPAPSPSPSPTTPPAAAAPAPAPELPKTAEAEAPPPVEATPPPTPAPSPVEAKPAPSPAPATRPEVLAALPKTFASVPDVDFGGAAMRSPVTGGHSRATYLSMLYGLITPRMRTPRIARTFGRRLTGVVAFEIDGRGRLVQRFVVQPSGSMELDEAAMRAVGEASRQFPPPPRGAPVGVRYTYTVE